MNLCRDFLYRVLFLGVSGAVQIQTTQFSYFFLYCRKNQQKKSDREAEDFVLITLGFISAHS